jgi:hypothetical protein
MGHVVNDIDFDGEYIFQIQGDISSSFKVMDQSAYFG